jgi:hypothetical protein
VISWSLADKLLVSVILRSEAALFSENTCGQIEAFDSAQRKQPSSEQAYIDFNSHCCIVNGRALFI